MGIQRITPNSVVSNNIPASGWPSGLTIDQVLSDKTVLTRVRHVNGDGGTLTRVGFSTYTLQSNERIAGVRTRMVLGQTVPVLLNVKLKNNASMGHAVWSKVSFPTTLKWYLSPLFTVDATDGLEWTQADIDGLEAYIEWINPAGTFDVRLYELEVEVHVRVQPTAECISPSPNSIVDVDRPRFVWRVQQEGDSTQNKFELKVFTKAVVEGGGFDPDTSTAVGTITQTTSSTKVDWNSPLPALTFGADYYWMVKTYVKFLNGLWASEWSTATPFSLNDPPTNNVQTPTGAITDTNTPIVSWLYSDPEFNPQSEALVRVFAQPGGTWVGFDPDVAVPLFEAEIMGEDNSVLCTTRLANSGTFRAYVKVAHRLSNGGTLWGPWDFNDFTTNYTAPAAPTLTASAHNERVMLTLTPPAGPWTPDIDYFMIERSLDGGVTWSTFRYGTAVLSTGLPDLTTPQILYDYEVPYYTTVQYRAFSVSTDLGFDLLSVASATASVSISQQAIWLKDPIDATLNTAFPEEGGWLSKTKARQRTFHRPLGRSKPVVTRGTIDAYAFSIVFTVIGSTKWDKLIALLNNQRTLYIQTPKGSWYVEVASDVSTEDRLWDRRQGEQDVWKVTIPFQEVDFA